MLRIPKEVDYGVLILLALHEADSDAVLSATEIASRRGLPQQQVAKLLKLFQRNGIVDSTRGPRGGYKLVRSPESLDLKTIYAVIEGPLNLAECIEGSECKVAGVCNLKPHLVLLNTAIQDAFSNISIRSISENLPYGTFSIGAGV